MNQHITVYVEEIKGAVLRRQQINRVMLDKITFIENGKVLHIDKSVIEHWELTGLNNIDFITSGAYALKE